MPEPENPKPDEVGTTNGEAVLVAESVPETAQNEPKIAESPTGESGQLGVIDPIVSMETSTGEALPPNRFRRKPKRLRAQQRQCCRR